LRLSFELVRRIFRRRRHPKLIAGTRPAGTRHSSTWCRPRSSRPRGPAARSPAR